ncbi:MauE/DoxX family redox-associated membrane protein [Wenyingzhuangia aestuarii]|uniref:MauE/DoxX family redox-associated membrane protein n=1 Tax=Wenyingzhuangia aestuarii TaxID=1647582 RepID=UPI001438EE80|nr:MauE/DoxX family redox-associated membrane protein [Wenyingzhuangia aestuarii]NJB83037.1 putative membrane protein YphA (DoxX/SURF4 family) [Wenyingzhuangia aestuarii]
MLKIITQLFRVFTGALFIFSGFVKLVDPLGSTYKFEEYFGADVLNLEFLIPYALPFAILLILIELLLGVALLLGYKIKATLWSLFGITIFFLFLTWYSAFYDKVTDCGCFGDAITLSPWETFYKNVIFIGLILWMLIQQKHIKPILSKTINKWILFVAWFASFYIIYQALSSLPLIDFRAYAVGKNIKEGMKYKDDGEIPPVHDFYLESETDDLTESILNAPKVALIVMNKLDQTDKEAWETLKEFSEKATAKGYLVYALSSSGSDLVAKTKKDKTPPFDILFCDGTTLKTMMRANPGILILENANVVSKFHWKNSDKFQF